MTDPIDAVHRFFDGLNASSLEEAAKNLVANVTEDFVWQNTGLPTMNGAEAAAAFLLSFGDAMPMVGVTVDFIAIAAAGNVVVTERVDHMVDAAGNKLLSLPLAGTFEVAEDGRISAWRDYFDPRPLLGP
ncbi:limonene-1,2-epoxide hydrolase family protein [Sporichthya sp.]|uniref:limonene-1,2-epoxide hydrolase family protein n=1 Tax=Sporichthya sp. TaxID=65475 RepID=UPI0017C95BB6|nr:limonene-1,2-epoxide hydrolase family protein [Sporichthya sp.]MBA3742217.1 nuclear transport factor 2 family protein [Sporichthya sp.]